MGVLARLGTTAFSAGRFSIKCLLPGRAEQNISSALLARYKLGKILARQDYSSAKYKLGKILARPCWQDENRVCSLSSNYLLRPHYCLCKCTDNHNRSKYNNYNCTNNNINIYNNFYNYINYHYNNNNNNNYSNNIIYNNNNNY